jgi:lipopolysaccharide transport system ATP-binding protein
LEPIAIRCSDIGKLYTRSLRSRSHSLREALATGAANIFTGRPAAAPPSLWALRHVDLSIPAGSAVGIIGRNGAGKSTFLKILARVTKPTEGVADVAGRVGSLLEVGAGFHSELTGRENIRLYGAILGMKRREIDRRFDEIVDFAEISEFLDTPVKRYSSGMYMRLAFAVAAHLETEILLVDEVLAVGDLGFQRKCIGRVGEVSREGRTVLFVSHNLRAVQRLCQTSILLDEGRVRQVGPTEGIISRYLAEYASATPAGDWIRLDDPRRRGNGEARFTALRYGAIDGIGGSNGTQPATRSGFVVESDVNCERAMTVGSYSVIIYDRFGTKLINADTALLGEPLELRAGMNRLSTTVDRLGLAPGGYVIGLWIARSADDPLGMDFIEDAAWFDVVDPESTYVAGTVSEGVVSCRFSVEASSGVAGGSDVRVDA